MHTLFRRINRSEEMAKWSIHSLDLRAPKAVSFASDIICFVFFVFGGAVGIYVAGGIFGTLPMTPWMPLAYVAAALVAFIAFGFTCAMICAAFLEMLLILARLPVGFSAWLARREMKRLTASA